MDGASHNTLAGPQNVCIICHESEPAPLKLHKTVEHYAHISCLNFAKSEEICPICSQQIQSTEINDAIMKRKTFERNTGERLLEVINAGNFRKLAGMFGNEPLENIFSLIELHMDDELRSKWKQKKNYFDIKLPVTLFFIGGVALGNISWIQLAIDHGVRADKYGEAIMRILVDIGRIETFLYLFDGNIGRTPDNVKLVHMTFESIKVNPPISQELLEMLFEENFNLPLRHSCQILLPDLFIWAADNQLKTLVADSMSRAFCHITIVYETPIEDIKAFREAVANTNSKPATELMEAILSVEQKYVNEYLTKTGELDDEAYRS